MNLFRGGEYNRYIIIIIIAVQYHCACQDWHFVLYKRNTLDTLCLHTLALFPMKCNCQRSWNQVCNRELSITKNNEKCRHVSLFHMIDGSLFYCKNLALTLLMVVLDQNLYIYICRVASAFQGLKNAVMSLCLYLFILDIFGSLVKNL
jgi:hypothetical protein